MQNVFQPACLVVGVYLTSTHPVDKELNTIQEFGVNLKEYNQFFLRKNTEETKENLKLQLPSVLRYFERYLTYLISFNPTRLAKSN